MRAARQESVEAMRPVSIYTAGDRIEAEMLLEALQRNDIQGFREAEGFRRGHGCLYGEFYLWREDFCR